MHRISGLRGSHWFRSRSRRKWLRVYWRRRRESAREIFIRVRRGRGWVCQLRLLRRRSAKKSKSRIYKAKCRPQETKNLRFGNKAFFQSKICNIWWIEAASWLWSGQTASMIKVLDTCRLRSLVRMGWRCRRCLSMRECSQWVLSIRLRDSHSQCLSRLLGFLMKRYSC